MVNRVLVLSSIAALLLSAGVCGAQTRPTGVPPCAKPAQSRSDGNPGASQLVIVPMPALVVILAYLENQKGSPLTEAEVLQARDEAHSVVMPRRAREAVERSRGYSDIDPERAWDEWRAFRVEQPWIFAPDPWNFIVIDHGDGPVLPPLMAELHQLPFDDADIDFEPFDAFLTPQNVQGWLETWTRNRAVDGSKFLVFGQDGTGNHAALWLANGGAPLLEQPVVFLGTEGGSGVIARNFDNYLWLLASGHGPYEAINQLDDQRSPIAHFATFAARHSKSRARPASTIVAEAQAAYPSFQAWLDSHCGNPSKSPGRLALMIDFDHPTGGLLVTLGPRADDTGCRGAACRSNGRRSPVCPQSHAHRSGRHVLRSVDVAGIARAGAWVGARAAGDSLPMARQPAIAAPQARRLGCPG